MNTIITRKPMPINKDTAKTCVAIQACCGGLGVPDSPAVIKIKKAGTCDYLIEYDATVENDRVCFVWDKLMWDLCGRYVGDIFESNAVCDNGKIGTLQFDVNMACWHAAQIKENEAQEKPKCTPPDCDCKD